MNERAKQIKRCSLCGREHAYYRDRVEDGWVGEFKTEKLVELARVICPDCLRRMEVKVNQN